AAPAAAPAAPAPAAAPVVVPANIDLAKGRQVYNTVCVICHQQGVAGAPKLGDKAGWASRLAQGFPVLLEHAIKGYRLMPARGGNGQLADEDVANALGYIVSESQ
ncbi:MAG TPA: c-type cytochrome, partial [Plasticicumulans sp.]|nr:c-type cytochrome [Plasticicumulans sp.]